MPLQVLPLDVSDFDQLVQHADTGSPGDDCVAPPNPVAWPVATPAEAQTRAHCAFALQKRRFLKDPTVRFLKVVDTEMGEESTSNGGNIVAVARWHYYPEGYDYDRDAHWEMAPDTLESLLPYMNSEGHDLALSSYPPPNFKVALHNFILSERDAFRPHWTPQKKPCWILMHLTTRPSHRKRGAAAVLIRWGVAQAAEENAPAYLEAGAAARPIYEKFGFRQVGDLRKLSLGAFGMDASFELTNMCFDPRLQKDV
jgi:GNAT superfamily N-acetyltransferase